jgi:hypothetical protein
MQNWPGLDQKWKAGWATHFKRRTEWFKCYDGDMRESLEHYASTGNRLPRPPRKEDFPGYRQWERYLTGDLGLYGLLREFELEAAGRREDKFNAAAAEAAFSGARLAQMIDLHIHVRSPERVGTRLSSMDITMMPFNALGVVIGDIRALPLASLLIAATRLGWYQQDDRYPVHTFILLLLARFLEEPLPEAVTEQLGKTPLRSLLDRWSDPDPQNISSLCAAACDFHTTRCDYRKDLDFSSGSWCYTPVEMMLLMRLRSLRGLANPEFEHPLWRPAFSGDAASGGMAPDGLVYAVEQRMADDGYDEAFISKYVLEA